MQAHAAWQLPIQWPAGERAAPRATAARGGRLLVAAFVLGLVSIAILPRFGLRVTGSYSVPPALMAIYGLVAAMLLTRTAELNVRAACGYVAVVCVAGLGMGVNASLGPPGYVSVTSFLLLVVLYAPFAVSLAPQAASPALWRQVLRLYIAFATFVAACGTVQFAAQFVVQPAWLFDFSPLVPPALRASGEYNTVNPVGDWIKSNGFFLREPSALSFMTAFAMLCELALDRRRWVLAVLGTGLVLSYSGSGLAVLGLALLVPFTVRSVAQFAAVAAIGAALYFTLGDVLNLGYTVDRVSEFDSNRSSAYCRFIAPGEAVMQDIDAHPWTSLLGHGSGTLQEFHDTCETTYGKLAFEYGLLGALAVGWLVLDAINRAAAPLRLRVALAVFWLFLGGHLLAPEALLLIYMLSAVWPRGIAAEALRQEVT